MLRLTAMAGLLALPLLVSPAAADELSLYKSFQTPLLQSGRTVLGQQVVYPPGPAKLTSVTTLLPPGAETGWHTHPVPLYVYVLEGTPTVDYGSRGVRHFHAGQAYLEAMNWPHNAMNKSKAPVRLLVIYLGGDALANTTTSPGPK
ncbi:MAG: cupin domain-containing protein [Devosia sp.]|nr:cupin domain-containing protein [Devosia sp.]